MFQNNGMPTGYDQIQPGLDQPNQAPPGQPGRPRTALQGAIMGGGAASQYPTDPSMTAWRQGGQQRQLGQPHGAPQQPLGGGALGSMGASLSPAFGHMQPQQQQHPGGGAVGFIHQWQNEHPVGVGMQPLMQALQGAGYNASPYMYGGQQSHNEIALDGQKFKLISGEGGPAASWYQGGYDGGGAAALRPQIHQTVGQQDSNPALLQAVMYGSQGQQPTNYLQQMLAMGSQHI
jgi:hypothetical protein